MIDIYTERKDSKNWIFYNDLYFNLNTGNEEMTQKEVAELLGISQSYISRIEKKVIKRLSSIIKI